MESDDNVNRSRQRRTVRSIRMDRGSERVKNSKLINCRFPLGIDIYNSYLWKCCLNRHTTLAVVGLMWHECGIMRCQDLRRMCWLWQGFHGIPIDPIPITFSKSPLCKAYLLTPQSNFHKSLQHDRVSEAGGFVIEGVTLQLLPCL